MRPGLRTSLGTETGLRLNALTVPLTSVQGLQMQALVRAELRIDLDEEASRLILWWRGKAVERNASDTYGSLFADVIARAASAGQTIEMHFESLEHFNSATIGALITFLQDARTGGVFVRFVYDDSVRWQKLGFEAMRVFATPESRFELQPKRRVP